MAKDKTKQTTENTELISEDTLNNEMTEVLSKESRKEFENEALPISKVNDKQSETNKDILTMPNASSSPIDFNEHLYATIAPPKFEGLKFALTRDVKCPNRSNPTDAGIDFYVPTFNTQMIEALINANPLIRSDRFTDYVNKMSVDNDIKRYFIIQPGERILIPSGVKCKMYSTDRALIAFNKSGVATKTGLTVGACVVDSEYQGEIHISLINTSQQPVSIYEDMKAVQFIELPILSSPIKIVDENDLYDTTSSRGEKGFGAYDSI